MKRKTRDTRGHAKENTDDGTPPKGLQTMEESMLDRYDPQGDFVWWRIHAKALKKSKKQESKRASHYALTSFYLPCPSVAFPKGLSVT